MSNNKKQRILSRILLIEIILFISILAVFGIGAYYVSSHPFFLSNRGAFDFNITSIWEKILSQIVKHTTTIDIVLFLLFPFIYIIQLIFYKVMKYKSKKIIAYFIILIPLYLICSLPALGFLIAPASYVKMAIYDSHFFVDNNIISSLDTLDLPNDFLSNQNNGVWLYLEDDYEGKVQITKEIDENKDSIFQIQYIPSKGIYQYYQYRDNNSKLKKEGMFLSTFKIDEWKYYDNNGICKVINETDQLPFMYTYPDLLYLLNKNKVLNVINIEENQYLLIEYEQREDINKGNPFWITIITTNNDKKVFLFDAKTGKKLNN
ncbi:MAG: hypothetical protein ACK5KT_05980 [Dysgonomonas sp.]